jgi:ABC-type branched-subunit amino acid transport system ATPase component
MSADDSNPGERAGDAAPSEPEDLDGLLEVDDVQKSFGGLAAVDHASFDVAEGSITGLIGPNGAGKSTLFNCITGVHEIDGGEIRLDGDPIQGRKPNEVAARGVGRTFQTPKIFSGMTVRENMAFAAPDQSGEGVATALGRPGVVRQQEADVDETVAETLEFLSLDEHADAYASSLSGGQRKLLELGRVLMMDPKIILLDEPMAGVNPALTDRLLEKLHALNDRGRTILLIEHDMDLVMQHCDSVVVLHNGATLANGPPSLVQEDERVVEAYLGGFD